MKKRIFALLMALCMVFGMTSVALAEDATPDGSLSNPYALTLNGSSDIDFEQWGDEYYALTTAQTETGYGELTITMEGETAGVTYVMEVYDEERTIFKSYNLDSTDDATVSVVVPANTKIIVNIYQVSGAINFTTTTSFVEVADPGPVGATGNPEEISSMQGFGGFSYQDYPMIEVGVDGGYNYKYVSESTGTFSVLVNEYTLEASNLTVADIKLTVKNETKSTSAIASKVGDKAEVDVVTGDVVLIQIEVNAAGELDELETYWNAQILPAKGSSGNPYTVEDVLEPFVVTVPAGGEVYYQLDQTNVGNTLTVSGENYQVIVGQMYGLSDPMDPENGEFEQVLMTYYAGMQPIVLFGIKNNGDVAADYNVAIVTPPGTEGNPIEIKFEEGKTTGSATHVFEYVDATNNPSPSDYTYYYKWIATNDGFVRLTVSATVEEGVEREYITMVEQEDGTWAQKEFSVEGDVWAYSVYNKSIEGSEVVSDFSKKTDDNDSVENGQLLFVNKGDVVVVKLQAYDVTTGLWADSTVKAELEYVAPVAGSEEKAIDSINNATAGDVVEVVLYDEDANVTSVISKEVLETLKGKDVDVLFANEYYGWVINGKDIENANDIDLTVEFDTKNIPEALAKKAAGDAEWGIISLADNDDFGLIACLVLNFGMDYEEEVFSLYYYNEDGNLECVQTSEVIDGILAFAFTHASDYLLVQDEATVGAVVEPDVATTDKAPIKAPGTGDSANFALWLAVLGLGVVAMAGSVLMKKREF